MQEIDHLVIRDLAKLQGMSFHRAERGATGTAGTRRKPAGATFIRAGRQILV
jgi:hypothetical protein